MTVTGFARDGDNRQLLAACRSSLSLPDKQQVPVFNGSNRPILSRQFHQKTCIAFVGLVHMIQRLIRQVFTQRHFEVMPGGDFLYHLPHRCLMP